MHPWTWTSGRDPPRTTGGRSTSGERLLADGGRDADGDDSAASSGATEAEDEGDQEGEDSPGTEAADAGDAGESPAEERSTEETEEAEDGEAEGETADEGETEEPTDAAGTGVDRSNVEVVDAGEAEPADPKWEKPDVEDIPEVEGPKTRPADWNETDAATGGKNGGGSHDPAAGDATTAGGQADEGDPTAGMPNTARSPGQSRLREGGADGFVVAIELCANLPEDVRLPEEAADLVPVALEAELEQNVQQFAGDQFDNPSPHVETLDFVDVDGEIWLRLRLGVPPEAFADLDPDEIREHALQKLEGLL